MTGHSDPVQEAMRRHPSHPSFPGSGHRALAPIEACPRCGMHGSLVPHCGHPQSKFPDGPGTCLLLRCKACDTHGTADGQRWYRPKDGAR